MVGRQFDRPVRTSFSMGLKTCPGSCAPRQDGLQGSMYVVQRGQQTIPSQVFTNLFFQEFVATGQVTVISELKGNSNVTGIPLRRPLPT